MHEKKYCPDCQKVLPSDAAICEYCGWTLIGSLRDEADAVSDRNALRTNYDLHYQAANEAIDRHDYATAQVSINRALTNATPQQQCEATALRGYAFLKAGDRPKAEHACTQAIDAGWFDSRVFAWRSSARVGEKRFHLAMDDLESAIRHANGSEGQYMPLVSNYVERARDYFGRKLAESPRDSTMMWQRGWVYLKAKILDKAERDFQQSVDVDPKLGWGWIGLALVEFERGNYDESIKLTGKAIESRSVHIRRIAYENRARCWANIDGSEACHEDLESLAGLAGESTNELFHVAQIRFDLGIFSAVIADCETILNRNPSFMPAILLRGRALSRLGQERMAIKDLSRYVHSFPENTIALAERAHIWIRLSEVDRALSDLTIALQIHPNSVSSLLERARAYSVRQQWELAHAAVERAKVLDSKNPDVFEVSGRISFGERDFQTALDEFDKAIENSQTLNAKAESVFLRGTTFYELGQFDLARREFEIATSLRPDHAGSWIWSAAVASRLENWNEAIQDLQRAIACRPSSAKQYQQLGRPVANKAIEHFSKMIERGVSEVENHRARGLAYHFLGEVAPAINDYSFVLENDREDLETRVRRGQLLQRIGEHENAVKDFTFVIHRDKVHHLVRYFRALSNSALGDLTAATSDILKSIKLAPKHAKYHILRGELVMKEGRFRRAIRCFDRAMAIDPQNSTCRRLKGHALMEINQMDIAMNELNRAAELDAESGEPLVSKGQWLLKSGKFLEATKEFERAIVCNPKILKGYLGKASALIALNRHRDAVIWLTKSMHQFENARDVFEILMKRGRAFYRMGLGAYAITDFSNCISLIKKSDGKLAAIARFARGLALVQCAQIESALMDFSKLKPKFADQFPSLREILRWLEDRNRPKPADVFLPEEMQKMPKPNVVRTACKIDSNGDEWTVNGPFNTWLLRSDKREFGPVPKSTLDRWMEQGRIEKGMKVVRGDWSNWKHVEKIYPQLLGEE
ncbi:MAG: tetratricopeptide repeat protein [Pirellulaceae bacterium]